MAFVPLHRKTLPIFITRLKAIRPDSERRWGRMSPHQMLAHLTRSVEISLGEFPVRDQSIPVLRTLLRWFVFNTPVPWPKGKIKAPADWTPEPQGDFAAEREQLFQALERFVAVAERDSARRAVSPLFGPLSLATWRRIHGRHFDHHLRQFGV